MFPKHSKQDQEQYELVRAMDQLHTIEIEIDEHGVAIYPFALPRYLSYNLSEIEKISGASMTKMNASIKIGGRKKFVAWILFKIKSNAIVEYGCYKTDADRLNHVCANLVRLLRRNEGN